MEMEIKPPWKTLIETRMNGDFQVVDPVEIKELFFFHIAQVLS